jgi:sec-independent protein translocase protein TatB
MGEKTAPPAGHARPQSENGKRHGLRAPGSHPNSVTDEDPGVCERRSRTGIIALTGFMLFMVTPPTIETANLGMADSLILMVLALVVFGPRRLPQIGRQLGKLMYEFRKASNDFKFQMEEELRNAEEADRRKREQAERQRTLALTASAQSGASEAGLQTPDTGFGAPGTPEAAAASPSANPETAPGRYQPEEIPPRIQPPSTGEPVAAVRPGKAIAEVGTADESGANSDSGTAAATAVAAVKNPVEKEPAADTSCAAVEPAANHG